MSDDNKTIITNNQSETEQTPTIKKPDENSGLVIEARFKIFDPDTQEVIVEGRA